MNRKLNRFEMELEASCGEEKFHTINEESFSSQSGKRKRKPSAPQRLEYYHDHVNQSTLSNSVNEPINLIKKVNIDCSSTTTFPTISFNNKAKAEINNCADNDNFYNILINYLLIKYPNVFGTFGPNTSVEAHRHNPKLYNDSQTQINGLYHENQFNSTSDSCSDSSVIRNTCNSFIKSDHETTNSLNSGNESEQSSDGSNLENDVLWKNILLENLKKFIHGIPVPASKYPNYETLLFCYRNLLEKAYNLQNSMEVYFNFLMQTVKSHADRNILENELKQNKEPNAAGLNQCNAVDTGFNNIFSTHSPTSELNILQYLFNQKRFESMQNQNKQTKFVGGVDSQCPSPIDLTKQNFDIYSIIQNGDKAHKNEFMINSNKMEHNINAFNNRNNNVTECNSREILKDMSLQTPYLFIPPNANQDFESNGGINTHSALKISEYHWSNCSKQTLKQRRQNFFKSRKMKKIASQDANQRYISERMGAENIKKSNFRGTSEEENRVDPDFQPLEINGQIILSESHPNVKLSKDIFYSLIVKSSGSATRLIRLLMKSFFTQDELAASSLSGEGIYKQRLEPSVTEAIKLFIRKRHPQLKTGSINLCMTDVCVQARRVANNQRTRQFPLHVNSGNLCEDRVMKPSSSEGSVSEISRFDAVTVRNDSHENEATMDENEHNMAIPPSQRLTDSIWTQAKLLAGIHSKEPQPTAPNVSECPIQSNEGCSKSAVMPQNVDNHSPGYSSSCVAESLENVYATSTTQP